ncbi:MAG: hypothetical protein ACXW4H_00605 [Candidatus Limnocylindrales bacterium]
MSDLNLQLDLALRLIGAAIAGAWGVAVATTVIVIISLWPLRAIEHRYFHRQSDTGT